MAQFCEAVSYALRCINREQLQLKQLKQEEALRHLYLGKDVLHSYRLREVDMLNRGNSEPEIINTT